jgi:hypothetical protein
MNIYRRKVLRIHAAFLFLLTITLTGLVYTGLCAGIGPYADLAEPPLP